MPCGDAVPIVISVGAALGCRGPECLESQSMAEARTPSFGMRVPLEESDMMSSQPVNYFMQQG